eukprot:Platyproteum_vivax@DN7620_c2_g2_i10.p1
MVQKPRQQIIERGDNNAALKILEKHLSETQNALMDSNQQIGSLKSQLQVKEIEGGDALESFPTQQFDEGCKTERFDVMRSHCLEELQNSLAKLGEAVQSMTQTQSEMELRFDSIAKGLVQTKHDLTLKIKGESRKFSASQSNLEASNKGLLTELEQCKCHISSEHEEIADLKHKLNDARSDLTNANINIKGLQTELAETKSYISAANEEIEGLKKQLSETTMGFKNSNTEIRELVKQCLKTMIPTVTWDVNGNVEKIHINEKWHKLGELKDSPVTEAGLVQMKQAMRMCEIWPKSLDFEKTNLNVTNAKDVADIINEHPTGFERIGLWNEFGLKNNGLQAIVSNLNASSLKNVKRIDLQCGLSGQEGGQIIHTMLEMCGNSLDFLDIIEELRTDGLAAAFSPLNQNRKIHIGILGLRSTKVSKEDMPNLLKNCEVTTLTDKNDG